MTILAWLAIEPFVRAGFMIVPLADRLEAIVTFAFDESIGKLGAFEVEELVGAELELIEAETPDELALPSVLGAKLACEVGELASKADELTCEVGTSACELPAFPSVVESDTAREEFTVGLVTASV